VFLYRKKRTDEQYKIIREMAVRLFLNADKRGGTASGVAVIDKNGVGTIYKAPITALELFYDKEYQKLLRSIGPDTAVILSHNRLKTQGEETDNNNNHPIISGNTMGIHNGCIWNDDKLFEEEKIERIGKVDSEAIFAVLDKYGMKKAANALKMVEGTFAIAAVSLDNPNMPILARNSFNSPCYYVISEKLGAFFFASEEKHVLNALFGRFYEDERLNKMVTVTMLPVWKILRFNLHNSKFVTEDFYEYKAPARVTNYIEYEDNYNDSKMSKMDAEYAKATTDEKLEELVANLCGIELENFSIYTSKKYAFINTAIKMGFKKYSAIPSWEMYVLKYKGGVHDMAGKIAKEIKRSKVITPLSASVSSFSHRDTDYDEENMKYNTGGAG
jgi:hypothetical protein